MPHAARRPWSWLIFDVRQKMRGTTIAFLLVFFITACAKKEPLDFDRFVDESAAILLFSRPGGAGKHVLEEVLKDDGSFPLTFNVGDSVRLMSSELSGEHQVIAVIGRGFYGSELAPQRIYSEYPVYKGVLPGLDDATLERIRVRGKKPNKAPEPTPGTVTPRASSSQSK